MATTIIPVQPLPPGAISPVRERTVAVALVGNPNVGKTTLFNGLAGLRQRVGNYPGVTVEKKHGQFMAGGVTFALIDLPGTYSLSPRSPDEMVAVDVILGRQEGEPPPDVILSIVDASNLERNLYLTTQVLEVGRPVVVALNMIDVAERGGRRIDAPRLARQLGVPVIPIQANRKRGLEELRAALLAAAGQAPPSRTPEFPPAFQQELLTIGRWLQGQAAGRSDGPFPDFLLKRLLLDAGGYTERRLAERTGPGLVGELEAARARLAAAGCPIPAVEARARYHWIRQAVLGCVEQAAPQGPPWTDRIDRLLTHPVAGTLVFLALMFLVFQSIFTWAEPLMDLIEDGFGLLGDGVANGLPPGPLRSLLVEGVVNGVGSVVVFLPQIVILFGFIAILEDCGYMARAAFLMDRIMARCGLSGKSFIPLLSSFACAVPGVMAARVIEDRRDRLATILVAPLMSCSARLPVYTLLIAAFIPTDTQLGRFLPGLTMFAMYLIGIVAAPLVALLLKRTLLRGETPVFILELPPYKAPSPGLVLHRMFDRGRAFLVRAGTLILASMILVWALLYFPGGVAYDRQIAGLEEEGASPEEIARLRGEWKRQSWLGRLGRAIEPAVEPLGWDWRIGMAALASFPAREVVVGTLGIIYDVEGDDPVESGLKDQLRAARWDPGSTRAGLPVFQTATALSLMVFFALCCQCVSTLAVIRRETNSWRWPVFTFTYMTVLAYVAALAVYQIGSRW